MLTSNNTTHNVLRQQQTERGLKRIRFTEASKERENCLSTKNLKTTSRYGMSHHSCRSGESLSSAFNAAKSFAEKQFEKVRQGKIVMKTVKRPSMRISDSLALRLNTEMSERMQELTTFVESRSSLHLASSSNGGGVYNTLSRQFTTTTNGSDVSASEEGDLSYHTNEQGFSGASPPLRHHHHHRQEEDFVREASASELLNYNNNSQRQQHFELVSPIVQGHQKGG